MITNSTCTVANASGRCMTREYEDDVMHLQFTMGRGRRSKGNSIIERVYCGSAVYGNDEYTENIRKIYYIT